MNSAHAIQRQTAGAANSKTLETTNAGQSDVNASQQARAFLGSLSRSSITLTPRPVIIAGGSADIAISLQGSPPAGSPPPRVHWQVFRGDSPEPVATGTELWPWETEASPPASVSLWHADTYQLVCEVEIDGVGSRVLTERFTARDRTLDSARALHDDQLLGEQTALRERLATETDPTARQALLDGYHSTQWIAHERGIQPHEDWARKMDLARGKLALPDDAQGMRAYIELMIARDGRVWGAIQVTNALDADDVTPEQRSLAERELAFVLTEAAALEEA